MTRRRSGHQPARLRWLIAPEVYVGLLIAALPARAPAQVNIEGLRPGRSDSGIVGTVGIDLLLRTGSVQLMEFGVDARVDRLSAKSTWLVLMNADLGFLEGNRFTKDGLAHIR